MRADRIKCASNASSHVATGRSPWSCIVSELVRDGCLAGERAMGRRGQTCPGNARGASGVGAMVTVLERRSESLVIVLWQDATSGQYGDQVWCKSRSNRVGVCALSGNGIRRGDPIYRPRQRPFPPANARAMILASAIEYEVMAGDPAGE
jgi:hypothetical protein